MTPSPRLQSLMSMLGMRYHVVDDFFLLRCSTKYRRDSEGENVIDIIIRDTPNILTIGVFVPWLYTIPEERFERFAEAALAVQWRVKFLRFELDESDGEVQAVIQLPYSRSRFVSPTQLHRAVTAIVELVDEYDSFLESVIKTDKLDLAKLP